VPVYSSSLESLLSDTLPCLFYFGCIMDRRFLIFLVSLTLSFWAINSYFDQYRPTPKAAVQNSLEQKSNKAALATKESPRFDEEKKREKTAYYVLENEYMQLVFCNKGGAVSEINLPFRTALNKKSVVLPIAFDRLIQQQAPSQDLFPLVAAKKADGSLIKPVQGGYYPLLRRSMPSAPLQPRYFAFAVVSEYPEVAELTYQVKSFTEKEIVFEASQGFRRITKRFQLPSNPDELPYCLQA
jgi:YidC/Oxa1 family membrane protein insertase